MPASSKADRPMRYLFFGAVFVVAGFAAGRSSRSSGLTVAATTCGETLV